MGGYPLSAKKCKLFFFFEKIFEKFLQGYPTVAVVVVVAVDVTVAVVVIPLWL